MDAQENYGSKNYRINSALEKILQDSEQEIKDRTKSILVEMKAQAEMASQDVRQHINKLVSN